jgi:hypothetical protein
LDNVFPTGSYELEEKNEWLMDFIVHGEELKSSASGGDNTISGSELEDNLDVCLELELELEPYDFNWREAPTDSAVDANHVGENYLGAFEGDCNLGDIANLWMF